MVYEFKMQRTVEFSDTDMAGIMHFANYFRFMEVVEHTFFRSLGLKLHGQADGNVFGWARAEATAYVGVHDVRFVCRGEEEVYPKKGFGSRQVRYRHYLPELARKPQAVRQVAPELVGELGEPYGRLWQLLIQTHGERQGSRVLAQILAAVVDHGEPCVTQALLQALASGRADLLALAKILHEPPPEVKVPQALEPYRIESGQASDYDWMLEGGPR